MPRHRLSDPEMLRGVKRALESSRTPSHLKPGLRRLRDRLEGRIAMRKNPHRPKDLLSRLFGF